jgi:hypothetical protein
MNVCEVELQEREKAYKIDQKIEQLTTWEQELAGLITNLDKQVNWENKAKFIANYTDIVDEGNKTLQAFNDTTFNELNNDLSASINVTKPELTLRSNDTTSYTHISNNATNASNMPNLTITETANKYIPKTDVELIETKKILVNAKDIQTEEAIGIRIAESYKKGDFSAIDTARNTDKNTCTTNTKSSSIQTETGSSRIFQSNKSENKASKNNNLVLNLHESFLVDKEDTKEKLSTINDDQIHSVFNTMLEEIH